MSTTLAVAIAKAILTKIAVDAGTPAIKATRNRLLGDPQETALAKAIENAYNSAADEYSKQTANYDLNPGILEHEAASELAKILIPGSDPSWSTLAGRCVDALMPGLDPDQRMDHIIRLRGFCQKLIADLRDEVQQAEQLREIVGRADQARIAKAVERLSNNISGARSTEFDEVQYLNWIIDRHRYIRTAGIVRNTAIQVPLEDVFVDLVAKRDRRPGDRTQWWYRQEQDRLRAERDAGLMTQENYDAALDRMVVQLGRVQSDVESELADAATNVLEAAKSESMLLILGDPGGGKTTLLRHLAFNHASLLLRDERHWSVRYGKPRFPILIRIGDFARSPSRGLGLSRFIPIHLLAQECRCPGLSDLIERKLEDGNCLVLLDGLDEVASAEERRTVVDATMNFVTAHIRAGNRFVVTSRIAGYLGAPLPKSFEALRLEDMDDSTIERFLRSYCPAVERADAPEQSQEKIDADATEVVDALLAALRASNGVRRLAANPLLLTALVLVHKARGRLPHRRVDAYVEVAEALGRTWRSVQGVPEAELPDDQMLTAWLTRLGSWMHEFRPEGSVTSRELVEVLGPLWAKLVGVEWDPSIVDSASPGESKVGKAIQELISKIDIHTGLLTERSPGRYGFAHLTFEEYYSGRSLAFEGTAFGRAERFRARLHDPRFDEPILLGLGLVGREQPEEVQLLVTSAIYGEVKNLSEDEDLLGRDFRFALRVIADSPPLETGTLRQIVRSAVSEWFDSEGRCAFSAYREALRDRLAGLGDTRAAGLLLSELLACAESVSADHPEKFCLLVRDLPPGPSVRATSDARDSLLGRLLSIGHDSASSPDLVLLAAEGIQTQKFELVSQLRERIVQIIEDPTIDVSQRERAVWSLHNIDDDALYEELSRLVGSDSLPVQVRSAALWRLGEFDPAPIFYERVRNVVESPAIDDDAAFNAALSVGAMSGSSRPDLLVEKIEAEATPVQLKRACLMILGHQHEVAASASEIVLSLAENRRADDRTREDAIDVLSRTVDMPQVVQGLVQICLGAEDSRRVRIAAASALGRLGQDVPEDVPNFLIGVLEGARSGTPGSLQAARAIGGWTSRPDVRRALLRCIADERSSITLIHTCTDLLDDYGSLGPEDSKVLRDIVIDPPSVQVLIATSWLLRREVQVSNYSVDTMLDWIVGSMLDWRGRQRFAQLIGTIEEPSARHLSYTLAQFGDTDNDVRRAAAQTLAKFAQKSEATSSAVRGSLRAICDRRQFPEPDKYEQRPGWDFAYSALLTVAAIRVRGG